MHDFHEVALRTHHGVDVLVRRRRLVDHVRVLAALDVGRCGVMGGERERFFASLRDIFRPAPWLQL
jgi:hypothetical protein